MFKLKVIIKNAHRVNIAQELCAHRLIAIEDVYIGQVYGYINGLVYIYNRQRCHQCNQIEDYGPKLVLKRQAFYYKSTIYFCQIDSLKIFF